ncbi:hypothetical protein DL96DRAFT_772186 [Flagelloscypha sp. PMI_526]|nr:hypothetical protein DL96DRAFT_772186 [Flagelloscypha sp. PMI_526]
MKKHAFENSSPNAPSASDSVGALSNSIHNLALHEDKTLSMTLDLDVIGYLCVFLTGLQLCRLRRVSKACLNIVDEFMRRAFSVDYVFSRFFTPDQITSLRRIQAKTNFVVSGSAAVQFFERAMFPDSDLDLYVEEQHVKMLALFITQSGYVFKHSPHQPGSLLATLKDRSDWVTVSGEGPTKYGFIDTVPMMVFTFEKELNSGAVRKGTSHC